MENKNNFQGVDGALTYLPAALRSKIQKINHDDLLLLEEIRFRINQPLIVRFAFGQFFLNESGQLSHNQVDAVIITADDMRQLVMTFSNSSFYALEEQLKAGYLTLPGGHRVGFVGRAVMVHGDLQTLTDIAAINLRIAHYVVGASKVVLPFLLLAKGQVAQTLIVSSPGAGKTTLIRDLAQKLSDEFQFNIAIVDERSEIAGSYCGIPQLPVGLRSDVLDGCPKAIGMCLMLRSMSPDILITDEIGRYEDMIAVGDLINAGVKVIATAHGSSKEEILRRPYLKDLLQAQVFQRIVFLSCHNGSRQIAQIYNENWESLLITDEVGDHDV